jgi:hypothetical protein
MKETKKNRKITSDKPQNKSKGSGEEYAAIAMALYSFFGELHDAESNVITIRHNYKADSQWCSKIFNMRNLRK